MKKNMETIVLTILFEEPFWIGLFERLDGHKYEVCKVTFGAEPKDYEVYEFILRKWYELKFSPSLSHKAKSARKINPKRLQREIKNSLQNTGIGTKAQQALKLQHEQLTNKFDWVSCGGDNEIRTRGLYVANVPLYQLSHIPMQLML